MSYRTLNECLIDLEKNGHLVRIREEVDPDLEMSAIHLRVFEKNGPAILFEKVKGTKYQAVSNIFGNLDRSKFIFRNTFHKVQRMVELRNNPMAALKKPFKYASTGLGAIKALPKKSSFARSGFKEISISELPLIKHWPNDGGPLLPCRKCIQRILINLV